MKRIEVEFRSLVHRSKLEELEKTLMTRAEDLGENNKTTHFFILPDRILKLVDNESKGGAKLVLKLSELGNGNSFEEIEVPIVKESIEGMVKIFQALGFGRIIKSRQLRHDYSFQGVEISLKHSDEWSYHVELEIMIDDPAQEPAAEEKIRQVAKELDLTLMTNEEVRALASKIINEKVPETN